SRPFSMHYSENNDLHWHSAEHGYVKLFDSKNFDPNTKTDKGGYGGTSMDLSNTITSVDNKKIEIHNGYFTGVLSSNVGGKLDSSGDTFLTGNNPYGTDMWVRQIFGHIKQDIDTRFSKSGGHINGYCAINPVDAPYAEGLRINKSPNGVSSLMIGGEVNTVDGGKPVFCISTNKNNTKSDAQILINGTDGSPTRYVDFNKDKSVAIDGRRILTDDTTILFEGSASSLQEFRLLESARNFSFLLIEGDVGVGGENTICGTRIISVHDVYRVVDKTGPSGWIEIPFIYNLDPVSYKEFLIIDFLDFYRIKVIERGASGDKDNRVTRVLGLNRVNV
ncbi:MAG: hypothetical protein ACRCZ2_00675, partial [Fusobacteriaceae bacterium]